MITLYYNTSSATCRQAIKWFEEHGIIICKKNINQISSNDLIHCLSLTDNGFFDMIKPRNTIGIECQTQIVDIEEMSFNIGIAHVLEHTNLLRTPIIMTESKLVIGYSVENIRVFIPKSYRNQEII